jgi:hypothetical protein
VNEFRFADPGVNGAARRGPVRASRVGLLSARGLSAVLACLLVLLPLSLAGCDGNSVPAGTSQPAVSAEAIPTADPGTQAPSPPPATAPTPSGPAAAPPRHLAYPAAGIDVVVHPLDPSAEDRERQTIIPPATKDAYWLTPYGVPGAGSTKTTYIVGHSWQDQDAPFNHLSTNSAAGDLLTVSTATGELTYRVESVTTYVKAGLKDSPIWAVAPNTVVLISCYTDDLWGTNVVVVAVPA